MGENERRSVTLGRIQKPPVCIPGEIFTHYQRVIGPVATLLWLNLRWAAHAGVPFDTAQLEAMGLDGGDESLREAVRRLQAYDLLEESPTGEWVLHEPLPAEAFVARYGEEKPVVRAPALRAVPENGSALPQPARTGSEQPLLPLKNGELAPDEAGESAEAVARAPRRDGAERVMRSPLSKKRTRARMLKLVDEHDTSEKMVSEDMQAVVQIYHKRIGMMGPTQYEKLRFWVEEQGMEGALVALAIEETVRSAEVPRISYLEGILRNWYNDGIRTLADVHERKRASKVLSAAAPQPPTDSHEGAPNADAYRSVSAELVAKWKELYPDEYDR